MHNAHTQTDRLSTIVWLILIALTITTYSADRVGLSGKSTMLMILAITLVKSQMVANYFIGLNKTRRLWRTMMLSYFLIVGGLIALAYLRTSH